MSRPRTSPSQGMPDGVYPLQKGALYCLWDQALVRLHRLQPLETLPVLPSAAVPQRWTPMELRRHINRRETRQWRQLLTIQYEADTATLHGLPHGWTASQDAHTPELWRLTLEDQSVYSLRWLPGGREIHCERAGPSEGESSNRLSADLGGPFRCGLCTSVHDSRCPSQYQACAEIVQQIVCPQRLQADGLAVVSWQTTDRGLQYEDRHSWYRRQPTWSSAKDGAILRALLHLRVRDLRQVIPPVPPGLLTGQNPVQLYRDKIAPWAREWADRCAQVQKEQDEAQQLLEHLLPCPYPADVPQMRGRSSDVTTGLEAQLTEGTRQEFQRVHTLLGHQATAQWSQTPQGRLQGHLSLVIPENKLYELQERQEIEIDPPADPLGNLVTTWVETLLRGPAHLDPWWTQAHHWIFRVSALGWDARFWAEVRVTQESGQFRLIVTTTLIQQEPGPGNLSGLDGIMIAQYTETLPHPSPTHQTQERVSICN